MRLLEELESSENLAERNEYARRLKEYILQREEQIKHLGKSDSTMLDKDKNIQALKRVKEKLANYDVYKQAFHCFICGEKICICDELNATRT